MTEIVRIIQEQDVYGAVGELAEAIHQYVVKVRIQELEKYGHRSTPELAEIVDKRIAELEKQLEGNWSGNKNFCNEDN